MVKIFNNVKRLLHQTFVACQNDRISHLAASLTYYTIFSLAPLAVIAVTIAGAIFGEQAAQGTMIQQIQNVVGEESAVVIQKMILNLSENQTQGIITTTIGFFVLLYGSSNAFVELQNAFSVIWQTPLEKRNGILVIMYQRFFSLVMVMSCGLLLIALLFISTTLSTIIHYVENFLPSVNTMWGFINFGIVFGIASIIFSLLFKLLPKKKLLWKDVWLGALLTGFLFSIGQLLIGLYVIRGTFSSLYGVAGSFMVILFWVYYSAQILFFGAEFTYIYTKLFGSHKNYEQPQEAIQ